MRGWTDGFLPWLLLMALIRAPVRAAGASSDVSFLDQLPDASESGPVDLLAALPTSTDPTLSQTVLAAGLRVGPYEIVAPLGAGAMGEVYCARDTKLNRDVALKVLPERFALDPDRLARFTREAHLLATLNHPNIGTLYGVLGLHGWPWLLLQDHVLERQSHRGRLEDPLSPAGPA